MTEETITERRAREQAERRNAILKAAKKRKRRALAVKIAAGIGILAVIALVFLLAGWAFQIAWNVGVVGLVGAAGGSVAEISLDTALGGLLVLMFVRSLFDGSASGGAGTVVNNVRKG